jgi:hypothetical protein
MRDLVHDGGDEVYWLRREGGPECGATMTTGPSRRTDASIAKPSNIACMTAPIAGVNRARLMVFI